LDFFNLAVYHEKKALFLKKTFLCDQDEFISD